MGSRGIPVMIGARRFDRKADAEAAIRQIFSTVGIISDPAAEEFLLDLLLMHPDASRKIGSGVSHFEVRVNPQKPSTYTPWLVRTDGSATDWSYRKCLDPPAHAMEVRRAMRSAIDDQIADFRRESFDAGRGVCAVCAVNLTGVGGHVDHDDPTFVDLAWIYADSHGGWDSFALRREDGMLSVRLADPEVTEAWAEHHRVTARLRLLCQEHNLTRLKGPRRR